MDARAAVAIYDALTTAPSIGSLADCIRQFARLFEHEHFICDFYARDGKSFSPISIHNYDSKWLDRAAKIPKTLYDKDPILERLTAESVPLVWSRADYEDAGVCEIWEEASACGISSGVAASLACGHHAGLLVGLSREDHKPLTPCESANTRAALLLLAAGIRARATELIFPTILPNWPKLTSRELDVLKWTREGKTAWEVGAILGISYGTTSFHLQNAQKKLASNDKHQAVLRALDLQLIR